MKQIVLLAGAAILASSGAALARPGNGHGHGVGAMGRPAFAGSPMGYGLGGCPPGLAKKAVPCMPPGQAKKLFGLGQRVPSGYHGLLGYNALPYSLRSYYGQQLDPYSRYVYDRNYIYQVDPRTMLVQRIVNAVIRPY